MATSLFQDSVEAFLRILVEHGSVNIGASVPFDKLLDKVGATFNSVLEHRAVITRLNKARVNFKHHGQRFVNEEALSFAYNVEAFLAEVSSDVLQLDFGSVSLVSAIGHRRTENWLDKAEKFAAEGSYRQSLECAAKALAIYSAAMSAARLQPNNYSVRPLRFDFGNDGRQLSRSLAEFAKWVSDDLKQVHTHIDLIMKGVNIFSYRRFQALTPVCTSQWSIRCGSVGVLGRLLSFQRRMRNFVSILLLILLSKSVTATYPTTPIFIRRRRLTLPPSSTTVMSSCIQTRIRKRLFVRRSPAKNWRSISIQSQGETSEYVAVLQDGESAYVRKNCVTRAEYGEQVMSEYRHP